MFAMFLVIQIYHLDVQTKENVFEHYASYPLGRNMVVDTNN